MGQFVFGLSKKKKKKQQQQQQQQLGPAISGHELRCPYWTPETKVKRSHLLHSRFY